MGILISKNKLTKLNKTSKGNNPSSKLGHFVPKKLVKPIYYAIFDSNMRYGCEIWGQNFNTLLRYIEKLQNKENIWST